jgi:hypothetical protein
MAKQPPGAAVNEAFSEALPQPYDRSPVKTDVASAEADDAALGEKKNKPSAKPPSGFDSPQAEDRFARLQLLTHPNLRMAFGAAAFAGLLALLYSLKEGEPDPFDEPREQERAKKIRLWLKRGGIAALSAGAILLLANLVIEKK